MLKPIKFETEIKINKVPYAWLPSIQLFDPYLVNYPIIYIHTLKNGKRIYGFPVNISILPDDDEEDKCTLVFLFLSNMDLNNHADIKDVVKNELENRIGISDYVDLDLILNSCRGNVHLKKIFKELWERNIKRYCGDCVPFGKFFEGFYSIVRFSAAFNPSSGRKSEMQMVYDFISNYGERVKIEGRWSFVQFFLLPTYQDIKSEALKDFPIFRRLYNSSLKAYNLIFTEKISFENFEIKVIGDSLDMFKSGKKYREATTEMVSNASINTDDKKILDFLLDAFNRYPPRARIFISFLGNLKSGNDYTRWNKKAFIYYHDKEPKGFSMKVAGCFLQQGFGNADVTPIDLWVEAFYTNVLDIKSKQDFLNSFDNIGKIERVIWLLSQTRKTNNVMVFDQMWCIKYGVPYNVLRGPNPLSCYECKIKDFCPSFHDILSKRILIEDKDRVETEDIYKTGGELNYIKIKKSNITEEAEKQNCDFICTTQEDIPKFVYKKIRQNWVLSDEYSGFFIHDKKIKSPNIISVEKFIDQMGDFTFDFTSDFS